MRWAVAVFELYFLIWFAIVGWEAFLRRAVGERSPFDLLELHHAYIGALLVGWGWHLHSVTGVFLQLLGLVFTIDDHCQHLVQTEGDNPDYQSPLHRLFARTLWRVPVVPKLVEYLDERWWLLVVLAGAAFFVLGCASAPSLVPLVPRPDTRRITSFEMDSTLVRRSAEQFGLALPNEASLCLEGQLGPRPDRPGYLHVALTGIRPAAADSADQFHVYLVRAPKSGCTPGQLVALAHDHTTTGSLERCEHSDPDAFVLFEDTRVLFSLVFCSEGRGEVLFQDGRRGTFVWSKPAAP